MGIGDGTEDLTGTDDSVQLTGVRNNAREKTESNSRKSEPRWIYGEPLIV